DDQDVLRLMQHYLQAWGFRVVCAADKRQLMQRLAEESPSLVLLDLYFGEHDGLEILSEAMQQYPDLTVILLTAHGTIDSAVTAIKLNAYDYLTKPPELNRLQMAVRHAVEHNRLRRRVDHLEKLVGQETVERPILGASDSVVKLRETIAAVAPTDATTLILGESGTGKELVARALHELSGRRSGPFVPVNMAALPRELVESTLFGHEQGSFTGAEKAQAGLCERAHKGTLFLDEIGEMDIGIQAKLLRFLQEQMVQRVGASKPIKVDVRIVAATNRDPQALVRGGLLREDLYYRLNVIPLVLPPLRERLDDVPVLAARFLERASLRLGKPMIGFQDAAMDMLCRYSWPGNIRQLENTVERMVIFCRSSEIGPELVPDEIRAGIGAKPVGPTPVRPPLPPIDPVPQGDLEATVDDKDLTHMQRVEKEAIAAALEQCNHHVGDAARQLGLGQATVYRKIKRYGLHVRKQRRGPDDPN
ncbi:MAG TPA: sigma-54 dependent transcriptional regulator, partial [Pirellulales bacterium]